MLWIWRIAKALVVWAVVWAVIGFVVVMTVSALVR